MYVDGFFRNRFGSFIRFSGAYSVGPKLSTDYFFGCHASWIK